MPDVSPFNELVNIPAPMPSIVMLFSVVGPELVHQHTPLVTIGAGPSSVTVPPEEAVAYNISVTDVVETTGREAGFSFFLQESMSIIIRIIPEALNIFFIKNILIPFFQ